LGTTALDFQLSTAAALSHELTAPGLPLGRQCAGMRLSGGYRNKAMAACNFSWSARAGIAAAPQPPRFAAPLHTQRGG